jgi:BolA family transcriptional regulator, general stress-responsive regulator
VNVAAEIKQRLAALDPLSVELVDESENHRGHAGYRAGGHTHWRLAIVSPRFAGQTVVARHRMVYQALGNLMQNPIHALAITARAPDEKSADEKSPAETKGSR